MNIKKAKNKLIEPDIQYSFIEKFEGLFRYIPAITLFCYICGFVIYKSFLLHYGIFEADIVNVKYIEAGILYLIIAPFILTTQLITNKSLSFFQSISTAIFAFIVFNSLFGPQDFKFLWKAFLVVITLNASSYLVWHVFKSEQKNKIFDLTESPIIFFMLVITSLTFFSLYFKEIKTNLGGGKTYKKILILNDKQENIIYTDSLKKTDTLTIIYESNDFIYFKDNNCTKSIRKDLISGEISIK